MSWSPPRSLIFPHGLAQFLIEAIQWQMPNPIILDGRFEGDGFSLITLSKTEPIA
ncbi:MAG: hypothetical protein F6J87_04480 [Spirulina sp. SIO3F2]|nr:hypothetical protein [Spirulina sp. SIO3F2]